MKTPVQGYGGHRTNQATRASAPSKTASVHHVRYIVVEAKQIIVPWPPPSR